MDNRLIESWRPVGLALAVAAAVFAAAPTMGQDQANEQPAEATESVDEQANDEATPEPAAEGGSAAGPPIDPPDPALQINTTRDQLEKWVEVRKVISQEKQDLKLAREMLSERIALVESEIESLRGQIKEAENNIAKTDEQYNELTAKNERLKQATDLLETNVAACEKRVKDLLASLPAPLVEQLRPISQKLPENPDETDQRLDSRFGNVIAILNEASKYHSEIKIASERRERPDGSSAEVTVMYLGAGKAYYVGGNGSFGGVGTPTEDGWAWTADDQVAGRIADAIAIYNNKQVAAFVNLPIDIQ